MSELIPFLLRAGALASMAVLAAGVAAALPGEGPKRITRASLRLCAHRGGSALWPENTLLAFTEVSKRFPGTLLESDARLTADGQVVLMHDETVDRTTNGHGEVSAMTLAELKALDAAWHFSPDGGQTFPCRGQGITVPTFAEALEALPESLFLIEIKGGAALPAAMVELLRRMGAQDRVILASFHEGLMGYIRKTAPEIATCFTYGSGIRMLQALRSGDWAGYTPE
ncbi:MAG: glycerophosphodiester phosphodiesterase, partial [Candidatus Hydrogenedentes bacterium]|nr:glycerophosphodiester phosphodiesterase [Candidatus Hydrogenedentota bacterium]